MRVGRSTLARSERPLASAAAFAADLQGQIAERFGLSASIGVGPNKLIAKMAAGWSKPRGLTAMGVEDYQRAFWPRPARDLWGVGPQLEARLRALGIATVGDLAHAGDAGLESSFGIIGPQLARAARGEDETPLVPYHEGVEPKSMGHEVTLPEDSQDASALEATLLRLCDQVARRLRTEGYVGRTVCLKIRNHRFETRMRQTALAGFTDAHDRIFAAARALWQAQWRGEPLRLIGVTVAGLAPRPDPVQDELFASDSRAAELRRALDRLRDRLGEGTLVPAGSLARRRRLRHVPFGALRGRRP
jgi:DNA polymerase-4